jgi:hypothetical protein
MEEQVVSIKTAKLAKNKGFNIKTNTVDYMLNGNYIGERGACVSCTKYVPAPTQSLLQRWLREIHNIHLLLEPYYDEQKVLVYGFDLITERTEEETIVEKGFKTYEDGLEIGLQEALKLI